MPSCRPALAPAASKIGASMIGAWILGALILGASAVSTFAGEAGDRHAVWRTCLSRSFSVQSGMTGRTLAADAALRQCRRAEAAYLAALSASPLLDPEDVARARPALLVRARNGLVARTTIPDL